MKRKRKKTITLMVMLLAILVSATGHLSSNTGKALIIGASDDDGQLYVPIQMLEGPDGNIYVMDAKDAFIKVYSGEGMYLRRMGGRGQGPGEMMRLGSFGFAGSDRLFFTEMIRGHRWITFMTLDGTFDRVLKLHLGSQAGILRAKMLPMNRMVAEIHYHGPFAKKDGYDCYLYRRRLAVLNSEGKIVNDVVDRNQVFSLSLLNGASTRVPFFPDFLWDLGSDGNIVFSSGNTNELKRFDLKGNPIGTTKTSLPEVPPVTNEDIEQWHKEKKARSVKDNGIEFYNKYVKVIEKYQKSIYKSKPIFVEISITPNGNILVRGDSTGENNERGYWLIDKAGKVLKEFKSSAESITISPHYVLYIIANEDGDWQVVCSPRKGSETEDLHSIEL